MITHNVRFSWASTPGFGWETGEGKEVGEVMKWTERNKDISIKLELGFNHGSLPWCKHDVDQFL